jgi:hypothetical protein
MCPTSPPTATGSVLVEDEYGSITNLHRWGERVIETISGIAPRFTASLIAYRLSKLAAIFAAHVKYQVQAALRMCDLMTLVEAAGHAARARSRAA